MDARRPGVGPHLPRWFLADAATGYLDDHDFDQLPGDWAEQTFTELARPVHGKQAPLRKASPRPRRRPPGDPSPSPSPVTGPVYRLAGYLGQHGRDTRRPICPPVSFWHAGSARLDQPGDHYRLAKAAYSRAATAGHTGALVDVAHMRQEAGDRAEAERLARAAAEAGHPHATGAFTQLRELTNEADVARSRPRLHCGSGSRLRRPGLRGAGTSPAPRSSSDQRRRGRRTGGASFVRGRAAAVSVMGGLLAVRSGGKPARFTCRVRAEKAARTGEQHVRQPPQAIGVRTQRARPLPGIGLPSGRGQFAGARREC